MLYYFLRESWSLGVLVAFLKYGHEGTKAQSYKLFYDNLL